MSFDKKIFKNRCLSLKKSLHNQLIIELNNDITTRSAIKKITRKQQQQQQQPQQQKQ